ncbi:MAG: enoyl-CoA hydratase/isomerase family protein [Acidimicrobiales bacterium]
MLCAEGNDPLVVVAGHLDVDAAALTGLPCVVVGFGGDALDVVVADDAELAAVSAAVEAHPEAAVALALLLRDADARSIAEGVVAESATYGMLQAGADHRRWLASKSPARESRPLTAQPRVAVQRIGDVLRITLDRPEVHNAYDAAMRDALVDALDVAAADPALRVELRGSGPSFCSGGDLTEFGTASDPSVAHRIRLRRSAGRAIARVADRVTAHVHGACVGAGVELPAFAGRVVADPGATFWLPELAMGLVPGAGGTVSITRRIGRQRTALLSLTGRGIDAVTALDWGLVDEISDEP